MDWVSNDLACIRQSAECRLCRFGGEVDSQVRNCTNQLNESAKMLSAQWNICCMPSEVGLGASAKEGSTRFIAFVTGSYWNEAVSQAAVLEVMGLKQAELVTGDGSGASPLKERMMASAQTLAWELAMCPDFGWPVPWESPRMWMSGYRVDA